MTFPFLRSISILVVLSASALLAQDAASSDPVADKTNLPLYVRLLPKPALEPWKPITPEQRFKQYASTTFSPIAALGAISGGAISQGLNSPKEWGQGWGAYGLRVANSYGATMVGNTVMFGTSALFHEDTRYFRSSSDKLSGRLANVLASPYVARSNEGHKHFSGSMFLGGAANAGIQLAWQPPSQQGWDNVALNYVIWYGEVAGVNFVREFYPSLVRQYRKKQK